MVKLKTSMVETNFCRIILPQTLKDEKLRLPVKFARKFGASVGDFVTLRESNGSTWNVKVLRDENGVWFDDGWKQFVEHFSIGIGYFLLFKYIKKSDFEVVVCDRSACEIESLSDSVDKMGFQTPNLENSPRGVTRFAECGSSGESKRIKHHHNTNTQSIATAEGREKVLKAAREKAIEAANSFVPANPYCMIVLKPSYVQKSRFMYFPTGFSVQNFKGFSGFIQLRISDAKQWSVWCVYDDWKRVRLGKGWYQFVKENNLTEGDVCVFELLRSETIVLNVTMFHASSFVFPLIGDLRKESVAVEQVENRRVEQVENRRADLDDRNMINLEDSSDEKEDKTNQNEHELYTLLRDMGISITKRIKKIAVEAKDRAVNVAKLLNPPYFMVVLQPKNINYGSMYVPGNFANNLSKDIKIIHLQDSDGRKWPVELYWRPDGLLDLKKGLIEFLTEHNVKIGDMCFFELIRRDDCLFRVYLIHNSVNAAD